MKKVFIANRGEIAVRVIRACADNGLESVVMYTDSDFSSPFVTMASEAYAVSARSPRDAYLNIAEILAVARSANCDAIHPGYGFLSENADFAESVIAVGMTWIGPPPEVIRALGDKMSARQIAREAGAPLVPGMYEPAQDTETIHAFVEAHGLPIIIKAAYGGGGRGMKVVHFDEDIDDAFESATRESFAAFGRGECFVERFLERPRHLEAQVVADMHGNVFVVGTRDCSLQRRNQKLIEEAPAPFIPEEIDEQIRSSAIEIFARTGYVGVGTIEFLLDQSGILTFLEVNTRLQVEHPVTEESSGVDLVSAQLAIAGGAVVGADMGRFRPRHSIELRINAEDPGRGFLPSPGQITRLEWPTGPGIRIDSGVSVGSVVSPHFDSLIAKIIVTGKDRAEALGRARRAIRECVIEGVATVLPFHNLLLSREEFVSETRFDVYTSWIEKELSDTLGPNDQFGVYAPNPELQDVTVEIEGRRVHVRVPKNVLKLTGSNDSLGETLHQASDLDEEATSRAAIRAPAAGILVKWLVSPGARVAVGDAVAVIEAMKMESVVTTRHGGMVSDLRVAQGQSVSPGEIMVMLS